MAFLLSRTKGLPLFKQEHIPFLRLHFASHILGLEDFFDESSTSFGQHMQDVREHWNELLSTPVRTRTDTPVSFVRTPLTPEDLAGAEVLVSLQNQGSRSSAPDTPVTPSVRFHELKEVQTFNTSESRYFAIIATHVQTLTICRTATSWISRRETRRKYCHRTLMCMVTRHVIY